jgi:hypothetical protein
MGRHHNVGVERCVIRDHTRTGEVLPCQGACVPCREAAVTGERFIPFRKTSIVTMCADDVPAEERVSFRAVAELLASLLHHEFRGRLEALKENLYFRNLDNDAGVFHHLLDAAEEEEVKEAASVTGRWVSAISSASDSDRSRRAGCRCHPGRPSAW